MRERGLSTTGKKANLIARLGGDEGKKQNMTVEPPAKKMKMTKTVTAKKGKTSGRRPDRGVPV